MPQMMPMNWIFLFIYFLFIFYIFILTNYFYINQLVKMNYLNYKNIKSLNWKW